MKFIKSEVNEIKSSEIDPKNIMWAISAALKYLPFKAMCLNQALVAQKMLKKRNTSGLLFLGVGMDDKDEKGMIAHAWVKCNENIITGNNSLEKYKVISTFTWN